MPESAGQHFSSLSPESLQPAEAVDCIAARGHDGHIFACIGISTFTDDLELSMTGHNHSAGVVIKEMDIDRDIVNLNNVLGREGHVVGIRGLQHLLAR